MRSLLKNNITILLIIYILFLLILDIIPINGTESTINSNYTFHIRWDYWAHFIIYGLLGIIGFLFAKVKKYNLAFTVSILIGFAVITEILQKFIPYRAFNINDLAANAMGVLLGISSIFLFLLLNRKYRLV